MSVRVDDANKSASTCYNIIILTTNELPRQLVNKYERVLPGL